MPQKKLWRKQLHVLCSKEGDAGDNSFNSDNGFMLSQMWHPGPLNPC